MKAITVRQPWAWAIVHGGKNIENRSARFPMHYRGSLAIHAAGALSTRGLSDPRICDAAFRAGLTGSRLYAMEGSLLPRGAIIGVAELVDVHDAAGCCEPWGEHEYLDANRKRHTAVRHLVLEDVRAVAVFHCRGYLGLWGTSWTG